MVLIMDFNLLYAGRIFSKVRKGNEVSILLPIWLPSQYLYEHTVMALLVSRRMHAVRILVR